MPAQVDPLVKLHSHLMHPRAAQRDKLQFLTFLHITFSGQECLQLLLT